MTDKLPRRNGGDGAGSGESPMEQLLREAMSARASSITAHDLRPAEPPNRRVRRLRPVYLAAVPMFALAAALAFGLLNFRADTVADQDRSPNPAATLSASPSPTAEPTPGPTASPSAEPTAGPSPTAGPTAATTGDPGAPVAPTSSGSTSPTASSTTTSPLSPATPHTFRGVKFQIPAGWRLAADDAPGRDAICLLAPGAPQSAKFGDCAPYGAQLTSYNTAEEVEHGNWPSIGALESESGWGAQPYCPIWGNPHTVGAADQLKTVGTPVRTRDIVAGRAVRKTQWQASCNAKESFTAQLWGLPNDQVFLSAIGLKPELQAGLVSILDTMDLSGRQAPVLKPNQSDIAITFEGLTTGQQVVNNGPAVSFSVTFKNSSQSTYASVQPLVYTEEYAGTPADVVPINEGRLERLDGTVWKPLPIAPGGGMDYATLGKDASFPLAPGQSRTVKYRMTLAGANGAGVMPVTAKATLPYDGTKELVVIGERSIPVRVTK
ncbi:hypothetical protein ACGFZP_09975 [Kitasatospora sp. NPDC048239]|uniref:hypothetical protein n=1 Tax=Kitasatospora sp. NPDC048239 TaxID=3364046 RepID=UPI0037160926